MQNFSFRVFRKATNLSSTTEVVAADAFSFNIKLRAGGTLRTPIMIFVCGQLQGQLDFIILSAMSTEENITYKSINDKVKKIDVKVNEDGVKEIRIELQTIYWWGNAYIMYDDAMISID